MAFDILDLGAIGAAAVNNSQQVAANVGGQAALWDRGSITDLGTLGGATSQASDINDAGQIVGSAETMVGERHAFVVTPEDTDGNGLADRWFRDDDANGVNDLMLDLGTFGGPGSEARAINNLGQVVGRADTSTSPVSYRAFVWDSVTGMQNLGTFGAGTSEANAINDRGEVAGTAASFIGYTIYNGMQAFRWDPISGGSLLTSFYGVPRKATGLNESGQIVGPSGYVQSFGTLSRVVYWDNAYLWREGSFAGLGFSNPSPYSDFDVSINRYGQATGLSYLWQEDSRIDLNSLVDPSLGWTISTTSDINDAGQILGRGLHDGVASSCLLSFGIPSSTPTLSIRDTSVAEGDAGPASAVFTVSLSRPSEETVTVQFSTADGTARALSDYQAASGSVTFAPGEVAKSIAIEIIGDVRDEYDETLMVNLFGATSAVVADGQGVGTILDNDLPPALTINDVIILEGNSGVSYAVFTVALVGASDKLQSLSFNYVTANGTASAGSDYQAASGTLTFTPSQTTQTVRIAIYGDTKKEKDETFALNLLGAYSNEQLSAMDWSALATIKNDDR